MELPEISFVKRHPIMCLAIMLLIILVIGWDNWTMYHRRHQYPNPPYPTSVTPGKQPSKLTQ